MRSASRAAFSVGSAIASSKELVCSDWVPPSTAAERLHGDPDQVDLGLLRGELHAGGLGVEAQHLRLAGSCAPNSSRITCAQIRRAARNFATSSSSVVRATKKNDSRGAKSSTSRPAASAARTYSMPLARVNAISCAGVAPASAMW